METIELKSTNLCTLTDQQAPNYTVYTGGIAGISNAPVSKSDTEALDRRADEIHLHGE